MAKNKSNDQDETSTSTGEFSAKAIQKKAAEEGRVIRMNDRVHLIVTTDYKKYKKGQKIAPHKVYAEELLKLGVVEKYDYKSEREAIAAEKKKLEETSA